MRAAQKHMVSQQQREDGVDLVDVGARQSRPDELLDREGRACKGMTKTLAIELGPFNVNVNCVAPGFIATAMTQQTAERIGVPFEQFKAAASEQVPLRRVGRARGRRGPDRLPLLGGRELRQRPGRLRARRALVETSADHVVGDVVVLQARRGPPAPRAPSVNSIESRRAAAVVARIEAAAQRRPPP